MDFSIAHRPATRGLALTLLALSGACDREPPPGAAPPPADVEAPRAGSPVLPPELGGAASAKVAPAEGPPAEVIPPSAPEPKLPYAGPWMVITSPAAGIYSEPSFDRGKKVGYARSGGRIPIEATPTSKKNCTGGWYRVLSGGFVCGNLGTTDLSNPEVKFATSGPKLEDVLPYPYARNAKNGTPLYKTVPSREQMNQYEPYLKEPSEAEKEKQRQKELEKSDEKPVAVSAAIELPDAGSPLLPEPIATPTADPEPEKPWWQRENAKDKLHELKLDELSSDADDILAKRMVSGFYVAVDKTFKWNGRTWYKTTRGLVAPADRFWQTSGPTFKGVELDGTTFKLPMAWVYGGRKSAATYAIDEAAHTIKTGKSIERFVPISLTGKRIEFQKQSYVELSDGSFMRSSQLRITEPGPPPSGLGPNERYVDVDLGSQTLVAFEGLRPMYATLISSGRESKIKDKDHRTPTGEWRVREKHVTTTMDGDGTAAGDLPYSIEDVPYVMYFHRSYALHGAFWHGNYGVQMSHGCVNLAPLDAKFVFFFLGPPLPEGFHGAWANEAQAGSWVVIHD